MMRTTSLLLLLLLVTSAFAAEDRYHPSNYKPPRPDNATLHEKVVFLPAYRDWERIDIYVPKGETDQPYPCCILFYGGGWGGKVGGFAFAIKPLVAAGYVVAVPDYVLGAKHPVPLAIWDGAAAVRFLRANAARYQIDPERIGGWGFSAGGWMLQHLCPADSGTLYAIRSREKQFEQIGLFPMLDPRPDHADVAVRLQGFASDWGAGRIAKAVPEPDALAEAITTHRKRKWTCEHLRRPTITADDPPLFTCHNTKDALPRSVQVMRAVGIPSESTFLDVKNLHVPGGDTPTKTRDGRPTTWAMRNLEFLDDHVKHPKIATAPEFYPHGVPIHESAAVTVLTVHPAGTIHYTTDGSPPNPSSPVYTKPVVVQPGGTLRAMVKRVGLKPSRVTTADYPAVNRPPPRITTERRIFTGKVGRPFSLKLAAQHAEDAVWFVAGKIEGQVLEAYNPDVDSSKRKRMPLWLSIDHATGELRGSPTQPGFNLVLVTVQVQPGDRTLLDTVRIGIHVTGDATPEPLAPLKKVFTEDGGENVRSTALEAFARLATPDEAIEPLVAALNDPVDYVHWKAWLRSHPID